MSTQDEFMRDRAPRFKVLSVTGGLQMGKTARIAAALAGRGVHVVLGRADMETRLRAPGPLRIDELWPTRMTTRDRRRMRRAARRNLARGLATSAKTIRKLKRLARNG